MRYGDFLIITDAYSISPEGQELIVHGTPMFPIAFYHDDLELMTVPWHWHEEMEAVYIESGETVIFAGVEKYQMRKGPGCLYLTLMSFMPDEGSREPGADIIPWCFTRS